MEPQQLRIEKVVAGGKGLTRIDGKVVFVPAVLPGELVELKAITWKKDFGEAEISAILEAHPGRISPRCPHYGPCGGCDFQYADIALQASLKVDIIKDSWLRLAKMAAPEPAIIQGPSFAYRNRMQVHMSPDGYRGLKSRRSNEAMAIPDCLVAAEGLRPLLHERVSPQARGASTSQGQRITAFSSGPGMMALETDASEVSIQLAGKNISFPIDGFFQSNLACLELLIAWIKEKTASVHKGVLLDLYGGVGTFACTLGDSFDSVWVIEEYAPSARWAQKNLKDRKGRVFTGTVAAWAKKYPHLGGQALVVLDPPREGLDKALISWIATNKPPVLVYVSCNPVTQARDAADLARAGYVFDELGFFDFYPQTWHMESCLIARYQP